MKTTEISKDDWSEFFDRVTETLQGKRIDIEIDAPDIGAQVEARKLSLNGLVYDRKDDVFVISTYPVTKTPSTAWKSRSPTAVNISSVSANRWRCRYRGGRHDERCRPCARSLSAGKANATFL
jgi:hypothetical protein